MEVGIYVKSHFRGNPRGAGEAAAVLEYIDQTGKSHLRTQKVQIEQDTRHALYLKISIAALRMLLKPCRVTFYMDCAYMKNMLQQGWLDHWQKAGWKKADGKPPANVGDWKQFYLLTQIHTISISAYHARHEGQLEPLLKTGG